MDSSLSFKAGAIAAALSQSLSAVALPTGGRDLQEQGVEQSSLLVSEAAPAHSLSALGTELETALKETRFDPARSETLRKAFEGEGLNGISSQEIIQTYPDLAIRYLDGKIRSDRVFTRERNSLTEAALIRQTIPSQFLSYLRAQTSEQENGAWPASLNDTLVQLFSTEELRREYLPLIPEVARAYYEGDRHTRRDSTPEKSGLLDYARYLYHQAKFPESSTVRFDDPRLPQFTIEGVVTSINGYDLRLSPAELLHPVTVDLRDLEEGDSITGSHLENSQNLPHVKLQLGGLELFCNSGRFDRVITGTGEIVAVSRSTYSETEERVTSYFSSPQGDLRGQVALMFEDGRTNNYAYGVENSASIVLRDTAHQIDFKLEEGGRAGVRGVPYQEQIQIELQSGSFEITTHDGMIGHTITAPKGMSPSHTLIQQGPIESNAALSPQMVFQDGIPQWQKSTLQLTPYNAILSRDGGFLWKGNAASGITYTHSASHSKNAGTFSLSGSSGVVVGNNTHLTVIDLQDNGAALSSPDFTLTSVTAKKSGSAVLNQLTDRESRKSIERALQAVGIKYRVERMDLAQETAEFRTEAEAAYTRYIAAAENFFPDELTYSDGNLVVKGLGILGGKIDLEVMDNGDTVKIKAEGLEGADLEEISEALLEWTVKVHDGARLLSENGYGDLDTTEEEQALRSADFTPTQIEDVRSFGAIVANLGLPSELIERARDEGKGSKINYEGMRIELLEFNYDGATGSFVLNADIHLGVDGLVPLGPVGGVPATAFGILGSPSEAGKEIQKATQGSFVGDVFGGVARVITAPFGLFKAAETGTDVLIGENAGVHSMLRLAGKLERDPSGELVARLTNNVRTISLNSDHRW